MLTESIKKEFTEHVTSKSLEIWAENVRTHSRLRNNDRQRHGSMKKHLWKSVEWSGYIWEGNGPGEENWKNLPFKLELFSIIWVFLNACSPDIFLIKKKKKSHIKKKKVLGCAVFSLQKKKRNKISHCVKC